MPPDQSRPKGPSWKQSAKPVERKNEHQKAWRREKAPDPTSVKKGMTRRSKLGLVGLSILAVVGVIIFFIWMILPPKPVYLALVGSGYEENLAIPHNVYGVHGLNALKGLAEKNTQFFNVLHRDDAHFWKDSFTAFQDLGRKKPKTFILVLALHGGADDKGPYLILDDANPGAEEKSLLRMNDLLEELHNLPEKTEKLLILDAAQVQTVPRLMLANDFNRSLNDLNDKIKSIPNLVVLTSAEPNQRSWYDEERRQTAFGHYLAEGLKGVADTDPQSGNQNGRVDALELYKFVQKHVERWVWDNRGTLQKPMLLPREEGQQRAGNMVLAVGQEDYEEDKTVPEAAPLPLEKLQAAWTEAHDLLAEVPSAAVYSPHLLRQYLELLVRAEQCIGPEPRPRRRSCWKNGPRSVRRSLLPSRSRTAKRFPARCPCRRSSA